MTNMAQDQRFNDIFNLISEEIKTIVNDEPTIYRGYDIELTSELLYAKRINFKPKTIYIVVKFLRASTYYDQTSIPANLTVLAEQNSFDIARSLMMDFITTYNLQKNEDENILQKYETPAVMNNFNEVGNGFRTLFVIGCGFLFSENNNPVNSIVYEWYSEEGSETITHTETFKPLTSSFDLTNQLDSQAFYSSKNLTQSIAQICSFSVSFQTYRFQQSHLFKVVLGMINGAESVENDKDWNYNDTPFHLTITFRDGSTIEKDMRLLRVGGSQPVDGLPTDNYTFMC